MLRPRIVLASLFLMTALGCGESAEVKPDASAGETDPEAMARGMQESAKYMAPEYRKRMEDLGLDKPDTSLMKKSNGIPK